MWRFLKAYRRTLGAALVVLVPVTMIGLGQSNCRVGNQAVRGGQSVTAGAIGWVGGWWNWMWEGDLEAENQRLRRQIDRLREEKSRLIGVLQENARLRRLLEFERRRDKLEMVPARVVGREVSPFFRVMSLRLKPEVEATIEPQMPVVVTGGVVGQIQSVTGRTAEVLLISDPRSRIDAVSQRNRAHGVVRGLGNDDNYLAEVGYLRRDDRVKQGDVMVTSGMGGVFPSELLLGTIREVKSTSTGTVQRAEMEPAVDVGKIEEVFIITGRLSQ